MPARNSDGTIRNARRAPIFKPRSVVARWVEAETIRLKQGGFSWVSIAEHIVKVAGGEAQPAVPLPAGLKFKPNYSITPRACGLAFNKGFSRLPTLEAEQMRRLDTERCEDIYRGLTPGILRGDPPSGTTAIRAMEHKARINGYAGEDPAQSGVSFQIQINIGSSEHGSISASATESAASATDD